MKKRIFLLTGLTILSINGFTSCNTNSDPTIRGFDYLLLDDDSRAIDIARIPLKFFDSPYIPYINLKDMSKLFLIVEGHDYSKDGAYIYSMNNSNHVYTIKNLINSATLTINASTGRYTYSDRPQFFNLYADEDGDPTDPFDFTHNNDYSFFWDDDTPAEFITNITNDTYTKGSAFTGNLNDFNLSPKIDGNDDYLPFKVVEDLIKDSYDNNYVYNGHNIYQLSSALIGSLTDAQRANYINEFTRGWCINTNDQTFLRYAYDELMFNMYQSYGLVNITGGYDLKNLGSFYKGCQNLGLEDDFLKSGRDANIALCKWLGTRTSSGGLSDGGHTGVSQMYINAEGLKRKDYIEDPRYNDYDVEFDKYNAQRLSKGLVDDKFNLKIDQMFQCYNSSGTLIASCNPNKYTDIGSSKLSQIDTIFYTFDEFDTIQLLHMYDLVQLAKKCTNLRNVVFDISCNGGGLVYTIPYLMSTLNKGNCTMTYKDPITGSTSKIDCNAGLININTDQYERFTLGNNVKSYIITTPCSFSCGNMLPCYAKKAGITIIGKQSGGGACVVGYSVTALGSTFRNSSNAMTCTIEGGQFKDVDSGVTPDIPLTDYAPFYNRTSIVNTINN